MARSAALQQKHGPTLALEKEYDGIVCGIDEAGRGPLAGPVVASCVYIPETVRDNPFLKGINDSKQITAKKRETLFDIIREHCHCGMGTASPEEIDTLNIHHATLLAMKRAFQEMTMKPAVVLVDGKFTPELPCRSRAVVKGDSLSLSIAAASIMAKVTRDRLMARLHAEFPHYGWDRNAGYGTAEHLAGIKVHGITPYHRRSYAPVKEAVSI